MLVACLLASGCARSSDSSFARGVCDAARARAQARPPLLALTVPQLVALTNTDTRYFSALQKLEPPAKTGLSGNAWAALFDEMVANEHGMLRIARRYPGVLKEPRPTAPAAPRKQFDKLQLHEVADAGTVRIALSQAGVSCK
jgi:hypothetical protein